MSWDIYDPNKMPAYMIQVKGKGFTFECIDNREALTLFLLYYMNRQEYKDKYYIGMYMSVDMLTDEHTLCSGETYLHWLNNCHPYDYVQEFVCEVQHIEDEELSFNVILLCPECKVELKHKRKIKRPGLALLYQECPKCGWHNRNDSDDAVLAHCGMEEGDI